MIDARLTRIAAILGCASLISGCGGFSANGNVVPTSGDGGPSLDARASMVPVPASSTPHSKTFHEIGKPQTFEVPTGVTQLSIMADGAAGGSISDQQPGGRGGRVYAQVPVQPGETLYVYVGGTAKGSSGGFNGGGDGEFNDSYDNGSGGGGGGSDVREGGQGLSDRIIVAGGGAGAGFNGYSSIGGAGGAGGPRIGAKGTNAQYYGAGFGGNGGTQTRGGEGGKRGSGCRYAFRNTNTCYHVFGQHGKSGKLGIGGAGGGNSCPNSCFSGGGGGGGGGGYYGGGGGGSGVASTTDTGSGGGGGGGSSYAESSAKGIRMYRGWDYDTGNGAVTIKWSQQNSQTFSYTGSPQTFQVPSGVKNITITAMGAGTPSASGGMVRATIGVHPGDLLAVVVGGTSHGDRAGYNGGGAGGVCGTHTPCPLRADGGAGASDIGLGGYARKDRILVAGGAGGNGGAGEYLGGVGGEGGGLTAPSGHDGVTVESPYGLAYGGGGGGGGTQSQAGAGGHGGGISSDLEVPGGPGKAGKSGVGGAGGSDCGWTGQDKRCSTAGFLRHQYGNGGGLGGGAGGGGGGGYYGGGGGGVGANGSASDRYGAGTASGGGGGGGSSYVEPDAKNVTIQQGGGSGTDGSIVISW
jgi:hypothetical protein